MPPAILVIMRKLSALDEFLKFAFAIDSLSILIRKLLSKYPAEVPNLLGTVWGKCEAEKDIESGPIKIYRVQFGSQAIPLGWQKAINWIGNKITRILDKLR